MLCPSDRFSESRVKDAIGSLTHRGPDASALHTSMVEGRDLWLGHTRLAILGLGESGAQPLVDDQDAITFNGEIYNFIELSSQYQIEPSKSDTRILFEGWRKFGADFLRNINGMAAAVLFRKQNSTLEIFRDHCGKKPVYIYRGEDVCAIASEIKAFRRLGLTLTRSEVAIESYNAFGYIPAQMSAYREVTKFPAGHLGILDIKSLTLTKNLIFQPFSGYATQFKGSFLEAKEEFWSLFKESVRLRLRADVPVGLFLSGGVDSTLVACALKELGHSTHAFTVNVNSAKYNEANVAVQTAGALDIPISVVDLTPEVFVKHRHDYPHCFDEPFADISSLGMLALSRAASNEVKVVLTGDGGDESFIGYPSTGYPHRFRSANLLSYLPLPEGVSRRAMSSTFGRKAMAILTKSVGRNPTTLDEKLYFAWLMMTQASVESSYAAFRSKPWTVNFNPWTFYRESYPQYEWDSLVERAIPERLSALDFVSYMRDGVLVKVDRTTMWYGIEARSPFLDRHLIHFAQSLPVSFKTSDGVFKRILRSVVSDRLPEIGHLPKRGFGVPLLDANPIQNEYRDWQSQSLREWEETFEVSDPRPTTQDSFQ